MSAEDSAPNPFTPGLLSRLPATPRKVAVLRASRIGDIICATPALRALREALPEAEITLITLPLLRELAVRLPFVDHYEAFPGFPGLAEQFFEARCAVRFFERMQAEEFDLAIQLQGSGVYSNPFTLLLGARATAGFIRPGDGPGRLDAALPLPEHGHEIECVLALTSFLGVPAQGTATHFPLWAEDRAAANVLLADASPPLIGLHAGAWDLTRRWPPGRFVATGIALRQRYGGTVVLLGGPQDAESSRALAAAVGEPCINLAGETTLPVTGAVVARLAVLVTNDSGPAHIAYALGTPTVTIFGGADPARYGPLQPGPFRALVHPIPCRPCAGPTCPIGYPCLTQISVEQVLAAAESVMRRPDEPATLPLASN